MPAPVTNIIARLKQAAAYRPTDFFYTVVLGFALMAMCLHFMGQTGVLSPPHLAAKPAELDLSGTWKIKFTDDPAFKGAALDDSDWCLTTAPNPHAKLEPAAGDRPASDCPKEQYAPEKMRHATYWYRKTFTVAEGQGWKNPSLFVGAIKHFGEFYLDGEFAGYLSRQTIPGVLSLPERVSKAGTHVLAVRVSTGASSYPGLIHGFARSFVVGEYSANAAVNSWLAWETDRFGGAIVAVSFLMLLVSLIIMLRVGETNPRMKWLLVFFAGAFLNSLKEFLSGSNASELAVFAFGASVLGFSLIDGLWRQNHRARLSLAVLVLFASVPYFFDVQKFYDWSRPVLLGIAAFSGAWCLVMGVLGRDQPAAYSPLERGILLLLTLNSGVYLFTTSFPTAWMGSTESPGLVIGLCVIFLEVEEYIRRKVDLAFFGRFIRSGLKDLLVSHRKAATAGKKIFRGKRVVLLKIDIIQHTATTFGMPYGLKRLYQDCWFSTIDRLASTKSFMDKGLGDGSLYYFDDSDGQAADFALSLVQEVNREGLGRFDHEYHTRMRALIDSAPELALPVQRFFKAFEERNGHSFERHRTRARYVLLSGMLDEGLWGLLERGHYDLEGDLITVAARIEKSANEHGLVLNEEYVKRLSESRRALLQEHLRWGEGEFKGIGKLGYGLVPDIRELSKPKHQAA